ncbi:MAG: hypothetical protein ABFD69_08235 [Candidatus Sumerlaeia bacterium]
MNLAKLPCARVAMRVAAALFAVCAAAAASAQSVPPRTIHYQGRLTDDSGQPVRTPQTFWFSLHAGGDALTSGSGTLLYRERAAISPDAGGVFDHLIGTGAVEAGSIDPADFATTRTVYIQVAVGAPDRVMLPRTRFASVGYAFQAENATGDIAPRSISIGGYGMVIDSRGRWVGAPLPEGGSPMVSAIDDVTGGRTVPGDLLRLAGSGLEAARVEIGGREAPVKSRAAGEIVCQVPSGLPAGPNWIAVAAGPGAAPARLAGSIDLTRYLVAVSAAHNSIWILDPHRLDSDSTPAVTRIPLAFGSEAPHIQPAFAHNGALMLLPDNDSNKVFAIDMTRNPPAPIDPAGFAVGGVGKAIAVEAAPRGDLAIVADHGGNAIRAVKIIQSFPPYTTQSLVLANETDEAYQPPPLPAGFGPRAVRFFGDGLFLVLGDDQGKLMAFHRRVAAEGGRPRIYLDPAPFSGVTNTLPTVPGAFQLTPLADGARVLVSGSGTATVTCCWVADAWRNPENLPDSYASLGEGVLQTEASPDGRTLLAAGYTAAGGTMNRLNILRLDERKIVPVGVLTPPTSRPGVYFRIASIEPVTGGIVAIATTGRSIYFYRLKGTALERFGFEGPLVEGELMMDEAFEAIDTMAWQP